MSDRRRDCIEVGGKRVEIGHAEKLMFPDDGITKLDLARYYARISDFALRHYRGRALSMHRFPDGIGEKGFFQKQIGDHFADWIKAKSLPKEDGSVRYVVADHPATLVYLADQAVITPHLALSRIYRPRHPDRMIFDLDPSEDDFGKVKSAARALKQLLDDLELPSFVQTTGSRGLHIVVPLDRKAEFDSVRKFAQCCCVRLTKQQPDLVTTEQRKNKRGQRVFLDTLRNAYGQTAVAPYAVRARQGAPVATPLHWEELSRQTLHSERYHIGNLFRRLGQRRDPWRNMMRHAKRLPELDAIAGS